MLKKPKRKPLRYNGPLPSICRVWAEKVPKNISACSVSCNAMHMITFKSMEQQLKSQL